AGFFFFLDFSASDEEALLPFLTGVSFFFLESPLLGSTDFFTVTFFLIVFLAEAALLFLEAGFGDVAFFFFKSVFFPIFYDFFKSKSDMCCNNKYYLNTKISNILFRIT